MWVNFFPQHTIYSASVTTIKRYIARSFKKGHVPSLARSCFQPVWFLGGFHKLVAMECGSFKLSRLPCKEL